MLVLIDFGGFKDTSSLIPFHKSLSLKIFSWKKVVLVSLNWGRWSPIPAIHARFFLWFQGFEGYLCHFLTIMQGFWANISSFRKIFLKISSLCFLEHYAFPVFNNEKYISDRKKWYDTLFFYSITFISSESPQKKAEQENENIKHNDFSIKPKTKRDI